MNPAELLRDAKAVIFDFDGPICSVFAGYPAGDIATKLTTAFNAPETSDPFEVLRYVVEHQPSQALAVHQMLESEELKAIPSAAQTPGAIELLQNCLAEGKSLAVASNNSVKIVDTYFRDIGVDMKVISGRDENSYDRMKPEPNILLDAAKQLDMQIEDCVFIGDSISDLETASKVNMPFIGYANKDRKLGKLGQTQVTSMRQLLIVLDCD